MKAKDFLNYKKPYFWTALVMILVLIFAGVVSVLDKEEPASAPADVPPAEEIEVEVEEPAEEPQKEDGEIILERFQNMDWTEVKENAKAVGEEGWEDGIVLLAELPEEKITLYGYNDEEFKLRGVAIEHDGNVNYLDWIYMSEKHVQPEMYWNEEDKQLQVTLNLSTGSEIGPEELHILQEHDTMTLEDFVYSSEEYIPEIEDKLEGLAIGSYADILLGDEIIIQFAPVSAAEGVEDPLQIYLAEILVTPSKDSIEFEIGAVGPQPEKRTATIMLEGMEEEYTEILHISDQGYSIWYPEDLLLSTIHGHEGFTNKAESDEPSVQVLIVPEGDMELDDSYLKEATGNYKTSGEYKKVTVSKIKSLKSKSKGVTIKMIEVVHDDTADRFYIVQRKKQALLITASMPSEALEGWGARINAMIQTITFAEKVEATTKTKTAE